MNTPWPTDAPLNDPAAVYRDQLKAAIGAGDAEAVNRLLVGPQPPNVITAGVICLAVKQENKAISEVVCAWAKPTIIEAASQTLFERRDFPGMLTLCDFSDGSATIKDLMDWAVISDDVEGMAPLMDDFKARQGWPRLLKKALPMAAGLFKWRMFRHLLDLAPVEDATSQARTLLLAVAQSQSVPKDIVDRARTWAIDPETKGEALVTAAKAGQVDVLTWLVSEPGIEPSQRAQAGVEAALSQRERLMALVIPSVDAHSLIAEFWLQMTQAQASDAPEAADRLTDLRQSLDHAGRFLNPDALSTWVHGFPAEPLPVCQSLLRAQRALAADQDRPTPERGGRPRA